MKNRFGFVANSSSSSFVIIEAGDRVILRDGNTDMETYGSLTMKIDKLIELLQNAKNSGATEVTVTHGGGYEG